MKAIDVIRKPLTQEKMVELHRALLEAGGPFVKQLERLYSLGTFAAMVYPDGRIEPLDMYQRLPVELQKAVDIMQKCKRQAEESVLRSYGIDGFAPRVIGCAVGLFATDNDSAFEGPHKNLAVFKLLQEVEQTKYLERAAALAAEVDRDETA